MATLDAVLAEDPDFGMAHALRADLAVMSSKQGALPLIQSSADAMARLGGRATPREQAHVAAAVAWMEGRFDRAAHLYGAIATEYPRDLVALQTAHLIDFYLGDSLMLRDRFAAAMPAWSGDVPDHGYFRGMYAFGLEETAIYGRAEDLGRHALDLNPRDPWVVHALIAYNAAGRDEHQRRMLVKLEKSADGVHTNATVTRELALPLARAIVAISAGRHAEAVELLPPVRSRMNRIGGSHAQRDLVQLTCIEAALRCGNGRLARALDVAGNMSAARPVREHAQLRRRTQLRRSAA